MKTPCTSNCHRVFKSVKKFIVMMLNYFFIFCAEELVSLRKPAEETPQPVIGEKLYTRPDSWVEEKALKCALESYKETLDKKRAGRICDLMQAEWNPELNIVTVPKLKGKFAQHMGHLVNGKHVLAPEEAVFLLENNCIEIMNGKTPMSTEEAFNMILKGNLGLEKYQVYSHLSKLGYVAVLHLAEAGVTEYEKEMNLDKHPLKKKRQLKEPTEGEPEKKRLTFTGALSEGSEIKTTSDASKENSAAVSASEISRVCPGTSMEEMRIPEGSEHDIADKSFNNVKNMPHDAEEQNGNGAFIDKVTEDIQSDIDKINHTSVNNSKLEARHENKDSEAPKEINSPSDSKSVEEKENVAEVGENAKSNGVNSQNLNELTGNSKLQNDLPLKDIENRDFLDSNSQSSKIVDVMDVDTDAETSCSTSEVSRDNFSAFDSNVNATSQDSCISVNNDDNTQGDANPDSNFDVLSMSCSSLVDEEDEVLTIDAVSADNPAREDDDDVTLLEVTKKETKPLAVIDLLSDDNDDETEAIDVVDDDITVLEEYPSPSMGRPTSSREINSKKLNGCKKEEKGGVISSSKLIPPLTVQFPDLLRKRVVCVARPPLHLLPNNVKPSKEAYVLNLKTKNSDQPAFNNRVWNSYRDLQDYNRQRRQNRHQNNNPRGQHFSGFQTWNDRNSRNHDRLHRPGFGPDRANSPDVNSNSRGLRDPPADFNRNLFSVNSFQNNIPLSNPTSMNCEVTIKEDTSESLVSSGNQSSHSNNFSFSSGMPNNPLINPLIPSSNFMAGIQRNAFSMGNVSHTHLMAELQRTCFTVATNMLSSMLNRNPPLMPNPPLSVFPGLHPPGPFNPNMSNGLNNSLNLPGSNEYFSLPHQNYGDQQRRFHRGRPFPCRYRNIGNKRSWSDVKSAVCDSSSDSDIEEMPISPREILWDNKDICPLVKPGVRYPIGSVFKFLQITQKAKVTYRYGYSAKLLSGVSNLEISFDVYPPGFTYKKTCPQVPKYRIVVVR
ncbi:tRNA-splicing endonuclease subunit Sen54 [Araneus ventricosus]|uniref:tRNA-splicing endonuclease subunit Sen54 n=1 Tax=Araneus ventricosus TaxID=182803 RepID=A0A4Y2SIA8_ARAVE|nr:tRNA-splicing endonuclease subunit Sen54 [Araneus ventricosus]GBN87030.1 tRNA-splicing endonuclease subunit Sen54 [Araneus ventricosus]